MRFDHVERASRHAVMDVLCLFALIVDSFLSAEVSTCERLNRIAAFITPDSLNVCRSRNAVSVVVDGLLYIIIE